MQPTDKLKALDLNNPDLQTEIAEAFPEHDVVVISGIGTPIAVIVQNATESLDVIIGQSTGHPLLGHEELLLEMLACEAYYDVPELSPVLIFPDESDTQSNVYARLNDAPVHTRREKPPDV